MKKSQINFYKSSTDKQSTYDYTTNELSVFFENTLYIYNNVSVEDYKKFADADSQGVALNEFIKGKYEFNKVEISTNNHK